MVAVTLAVATLFRPARRRIQTAVDRRFNRRRYHHGLLPGPTEHVIPPCSAAIAGRAGYWSWLLVALLTDPSKELYGVEIGAAAGLPSGTVHPILARLETVGWLTSRWEDIDPRAEGRPARRYYQFTPDGLELARAALARAYSATARPAWLRPLGEES